MTLYSFSEQLIKGEEYELILDEFFSSKYDVEHVQLEVQRWGIDRIFTRKSSGVIASVEYKTDFIAQRTGNVFVETETVGGTGKQGWAFCSIAQLLVYFIPELNVIYVADMLKIKLDIDKLAVRYDVKTVDNGHFKMMGVPIPFEVFDKYVISTIKWEGQ